MCHQNCNATGCTTHARRDGGPEPLRALLRLLIFDKVAILLLFAVETYLHTWAPKGARLTTKKNVFLLLAAKHAV